MCPLGNTPPFIDRIILISRYPFLCFDMPHFNFLLLTFIILFLLCWSIIFLHTPISLLVFRFIPTLTVFFYFLHMVYDLTTKSFGLKSYKANELHGIISYMALCCTPFTSFRLFHRGRMNIIFSKFRSRIVSYCRFGCHFNLIVMHKQVITFVFLR